MTTPIEEQALIDPPSYNAVFYDRNSFIYKVYTILYIQMLVTIGICSLFIYNENIKNYIQGTNGQAMLITSLVFQFVLIIILSCTGIHRTKPWNFIILGLFTLFLSYTLGVISSYYDTNTLLIAGGATCLITFGLTLFACQTKYDFTGYGPYLLCFLLILIFMGTMSIFIHNQIYNLIYSCLGALIFSFYIVYDTQLIIGGKHTKYKYDDEDYVIAALSLYLDIINLFIYILEILNKK